MEIHRIRRWSLAVLVLFVPQPLVAATPESSFLRVAKLYSTADGTTQAIELDIVKVADTPIAIAGTKVTARDRRGNVRSFALGELVQPADGRSTLVLVGSVWLDDTDDGWGVWGDLPMPRYFLPVDGGVVSIEGMDEVDYGPLPADGRHALARDGAVVDARFDYWGTFEVFETYVTEFHHAALDHYFMTDRANEIALLRSGAIPGWAPTGKAFIAYASSIDGKLAPVCRFLLQRPDGYSHFFSASSQECAALAGGNGNHLESSAIFHAGLVADGVCGSLTLRYTSGGSARVPLEPIYRLWNGDAAVPNHRYLADAAERDAMIARGWILESPWASGASMCGHSADPPPLP